MKNVTKEAARDAFEYASAMMAYGEGAGVRRRHIETAVMFKKAHIPGYDNAFMNASDRVDMVKAVKSAKRVRATKDVGAVTSRNIRAMARGDKNGMSTPIIIAVVVAGVAHKTGYDKVALAYGKRKSQDIRAWLKRKL